MQSYDQIARNDPMPQPRTNQAAGRYAAAQRYFAEYDWCKVVTFAKPNRPEEIRQPYEHEIIDVAEYVSTEGVFHDAELRLPAGRERVDKGWVGRSQAEPTKSVVESEAKQPQPIDPRIVAAFQRVQDALEMLLGEETYDLSSQRSDVVLEARRAIEALTQP